MKEKVKGETDILEGNRFIAQFDGWKFIPAHDWTFGKDVIKYKDSWVKTIDGKCNQISEPPKYNLSWDLLMPIIKRAKHIELKYDYDWVLINMWLDSANIEKAFLAVVEFIKWYNQNK